MPLLVEQIVHLSPCSQHRLPRSTATPACFQQYGGPYRVVRFFKRGAVLLQHTKSKNLGLADTNAIIAEPQ